MFRRWFQYGETEVANNHRVSSYVKNGLKPTGVVIGDCGDCGDLPFVTAGVQEYETPALDDAPWYTPEDPDSADFAGVFIRDVTGLEGSTTTVTVEESIGDGGIPGTRRANSRTVAVTADVIGRTPEAAAVGIEWLSSVLHPPCAEGSDCAGDTLHLFSTCPAACVGQTDQDAPMVTTTYGESSSFQTTAIIAHPQPVVTNIIQKPSAEGGVATTPWTITNTAFGSYVGGGSFTFAAPPVALSRPNALRAVAPALNDGQSVGLMSNWTIPEDGWYEYSAWVYAPAACTLSFAGGRLFGESGPFTDVKDRWVRLSARAQMTAGASSYLVISGRNNTGAAVPAGQVFYVDGASIRKMGSGQASADGQGRLPTDVEGWNGNSVFGSFTPAAGVTNVAFASPNAFNSTLTNPRSIRVEWAAALNPGTAGHAAYTTLQGLTNNQVYTVECDVYLTAGCADMESDVMFNGKGQVISQKGQWVHVRNTFAATHDLHFFGFTSKAGQDMSGSGQFMYVANLRLWPGFSVPSLNYFDGATTDLGLGNLIPNPDFAVDTTGWQTNGAAVIQRDVDVSRLGLASARVDVTAGNDGIFLNPAVAAPTGTRYWGRVWLKGSGSGLPENVNVRLSGSSGASLDQKTVTLTGDWQEVSVQGLNPFGSSNVYLFVFAAAGSTPFTFWVDDTEMQAVQPTNYDWTGTADSSTSTATMLGDDFIFKPDAGDSLLLGPILPGVCDEVEIEWLVSSSMGSDVEVFAAPATPGGTLLSEGDRYIIDGTPTSILWSGEQTPGFPDDWRPTLTTVPGPGQGLNGRQLTIHGLRVTHRPVLSVEECVKPYRRSLQGVVTVEGPKVLEWLTLGDTDDGSTAARVEWTWVATEPHVWHDPTPIITDAAGKTNTQAYQAPGVPISAPANAAVNATACARPAVTALTCADNTLGPGITLPPQPPVITESGIMNLAGSNRTRRTFEIPEDISPLGAGKLSWRFVNDDKPKFGIRVRIYEDTDPAFVQPSECTFAEEFTVEYLAPNQTLYINGPADDVYVRCGTDAFGEPVYATALKNVRGNYGGPFVNNLIGCGRPYFISVDVPNTYTNSPSNISGQTTGSDQGDVLWSVDLVRRA